jgi:hypothetical protein
MGQDMFISIFIPELGTSFGETRQNLLKGESTSVVQDFWSLHFDGIHVGTYSKYKEI